MYVEIIAVKAGLHDLAVFLPPQDLNIHPRRPPARQLARVAPQQMVEGISELPTVLTSFDTVLKSNCRGASPPLLNHGLHAIDATSLVDLRTGISANSHRCSTAAASTGATLLFKADCSAPTAHPYQTR